MPQQVKHSSAFNGQHSVLVSSFSYGICYNGDQRLISPALGHRESTDDLLLSKPWSNSEVSLSEASAVSVMCSLHWLFSYKSR